ncbi:MAG: hypothetical protein K6T66_08195 [Peptococcaceae bacterium]|nr:hypothetical protein [Peptococcaceae bacterium]
MEETSPGYGRTRTLISVVMLIVMTVLSLSWPDIETGNGPAGEAYGEYADWQEVRLFFPRNGIAEVVDCDTGVRFSVRRWGGSYHADVEPVTARDAEALKQIYGGKWSWKRRAVLVRAGGRQIAASMNGMPHGGGGIRDNDFPGHFCLHFRGSKLHLNGKEDLAHRIMVCKAAGVLEETMRKAPAVEAVKIFFTAVDQKELNIAVRAAFFHDPAEVVDFFGKAAEINRLAVHRASMEGEDVADVSLGVVFNNGDNNYNKRGKVRALYHSYAGWRVDYPSAESLLDGGEGIGAGSPAAGEGEDID